MIRFLKNFKEDQSGIALVLVLTVLFSVMFSVLVISYIIGSETKISKQSSNAIMAYYIAESGIEKGLYYLKDSRNSNDYTIFTGLQGFTTSTGNGGSFLISTSSLAAPDFLATDIPTSSPVYVDIIEPLEDVQGINWGTATQFDVDWQILNCFPDYASARMQITANSFESNFTNPESVTYLAVCNCNYGSDACDTYSGPVSANKYYRFTFKPLDIKLKQVEFAIDNSGNGIPSESLIESYGTYGESRYYIKAQIPAFGSAFDIFQYIIFSEENLTK